MPQSSAEFILDQGQFAARIEHLFPRLADFQTGAWHLGRIVKVAHSGSECEFGVAFGVLLDGLEISLPAVSSSRRLA